MLQTIYVVAADNFNLLFKKKITSAVRLAVDFQSCFKVEKSCFLCRIIAIKNSHYSPCNCF